MLARLKSTIGDAAFCGAIVGLVAGGIYVQFSIIYDCGWFALLRGVEILWFVGACR